MGSGPIARPLLALAAAAALAGGPLACGGQGGGDDDPGGGPGAGGGADGGGGGAGGGGGGGGAGSGGAGSGGDGPPACEPPCAGAQTCGAGGLCIEPDRCSGDLDCRPGRRCFAHGRCTDVCTAATCPRADLCARRRCVPPAPCAADGSCGQGGQCHHGLCRPPCDGDGDCPGRQTCGPGGACVEPAGGCVSHRDCSPGRDCVDGACVDAAPRACDDHAGDGAGGCPDGGRCGPGGICGPAPTCDGDDACRRGVCGPYGRCGECRADADCGGAKTCDGLAAGLGRCAEPAACIAAGDCLRARVCGPTGLCADDRGCVEDAFAGNHGRETAAPLLDVRRTGLMRCAGADDWFRISMPPEFAAEVYLVDHTDAGLILEVYEASAPEAPAMVADSPGPAERVAIRPEVSQHAPLVRVTGPAGAAGPYDLDVRLRSFGVCMDDPGDDWGGDDDPDHALPLPDAAGAIAGRRLCDADWYSVRVERPSRIDAQVLGESAAAGLTLRLYDDAGGVVFPEQPHLSEVEGVGLSPGRYLLEVAGFARAGTAYALGWRLSADPLHLRERCEQAEELRSGDRWFGRLSPDAPDEFAGSCAPNDDGGPEAVARVTLDATADLLLRVDSADFSPVLYLRRDCAALAPEAACAVVPEELYGGRLEPGPWFLFLDPYGPLGEGRFEATLVTGSIAPPGENDTCERPARLQPDAAGAFAVEGDTGGASADLEAPGCAPFGDTAASPDLVYLLRTEEDLWLTAEVRPSGWDAVLALYNGGCEEARLVACGDEPAQVNLPRLPPGDHYLVVDGYRADEAGAFTLVGQLRPPPPAPPNDRCERATPLTPDPETGRAEASGTTLAATDQGEAACALAASRLAPDLFFRFTLEDPADIRVEVRPSGDFEPAIALRSGGCRDSAELVCTTAAPYALRADGLLAGDYLIIVDGARPGARGDFDLTLSVQPL